MESRPQFVKMNAQREEDPPRRDVGCIDYKTCLSLAAHHNFCLDCSRCEAAAAPVPPVRKSVRPANGRRGVGCAAP